MTGGILGVLARSVGTRRRVRLVIEAGYDAIVWIGGLLAAARAAGALTDAGMTRLEFWYGTAATCLTVAGCGLAAGLYRGRNLRGSRDEVAAVVLACFLTACCLAVAGLTLVTGRRTLAETVLGGAAFAVVAMLGARYVAFAARLRSRPRPRPP